jgi:RNA polymerase sigma factor (sigma-70 family)
VSRTQTLTSPGGAVRDDPPAPGSSRVPSAEPQATAGAATPPAATPRRSSVRRSRAERDALVLANLHLVAQVARQLRMEATAAADLDDFRSAGTLGLLIAAARWDPAGGEFEAYAWVMIAGAMRRLARDSRWRRKGTPRPGRILVSLDSLVPGTTMTVADTIADQGDGPGDELLRKMHKMHVLTVLSHLPDGDRALLHARYINGFRQDVTAALLGLTIGQVQWRMQIARQRFARAWRSANLDPGPPRAAAATTRAPRSIA